MPNENKTRKRRTPEQILADLEAKKREAEEIAKKKQDQLNAQIRDTRAKMSEKKRKEDTHLKVVNGALCFAFFENNPHLAKQYLEWVRNSGEAEETKAKLCERITNALPDDLIKETQDSPPIRSSFMEKQTG